MGHANMHNFIKREAQTVPPQIFPSSRIVPGESAAPGTSLTFDGQSQSAYTTLLQTVEQPITQPATTVTATTVRSILVTDAASFSALQASESNSRAKETQSTSQTSAASSETSKAASSSSSSSNLSTLIPAIVVPITIVLVASFALFWFFMRRRHRRRVKEEPQFVMANKVEKSTISRGNSNSSGHSSTRELVPMSKLEKEVAVTTSEVRKPSFDLFPSKPPRYASPDASVARPITSPGRARTAGGSNERAVPNFSSVRPNTSRRPKTSHDEAVRGQSRGQSGPASRGASSSRNSPPRLDLDLFPNPQSPARQPQRPPRPDEVDSMGSDRSPPRAPASLNTNLNKGNRAPPPRSLNPPTPTGAFNGASPISQYSPIVKDQPNLGAIASAGELDKRGHSPQTSQNSTRSPGDEDILSNENMRIARFANSSRLGVSNSPVQPGFPNAAGKSSQMVPSITSPQLPPPLSRDDMPPKLFAKGPRSPAAGSSVYPSPAVGVGQTPQIGGGPSTTSLTRHEQDNGTSSASALQRHVSMISQLSSDDEYVDMELDAKSEVSSLDERERWEMESERHDSESLRGTGHHEDGYGSAGMSPIDATASSLSKGTGKPNLRDRDSEGPFVLSRY